VGHVLPGSRDCDFGCGPIVIDWVWPISPNGVNGMWFGFCARLFPGTPGELNLPKNSGIGWIYPLDFGPTNGPWRTGEIPTPYRGTPEGP